MREELVQLVKKSIVFEYRLPNIEKDIDKTAITTCTDWCFSNSNSMEVSEIIYNSIVEYAKNEYKIDYEDLDKEQLKALKLSLRYDEDAKEDTKQKYGFFGEVLLYTILKVHLGADVLVSKGYFYSPLENSEAKGYDVFHLIETNNKLQLWFGESKFRQKYSSSIDDIIKGIPKAISDNYFDRNMLAIIDQKSNFTTKSNILSKVIEKWESNPEIKISSELKTNNIELVYPMFVAFDKGKTNYDKTIKKIIDYIKNETDTCSFKKNATFSVTLFFIFLPLNDVGEIKRDVIKWITEKKPLI